MQPPPDSCARIEGASSWNAPRSQSGPTGVKGPHATSGMTAGYGSAREKVHSSYQNRIGTIVPTHPSSQPFDPLDLRALGDSLALAIRERLPTPLANVGSFTGAGVYALYYGGTNELYTALTEINSTRAHDPLPIYVGRSKDSGARRGLDPFSPATTPLLAGRIKHHRSSIEAARNLEVADFSVRWLVTMPIWVPLAEAMLIRRYQPVWNTLMPGFGIHAPGKGRARQERSVWDTLHPGRGFAEELPAQSDDSLHLMAEKIASHIAAITSELA